MAKPKPELQQFVIHKEDAESREQWVVETTNGKVLNRTFHVSKTRAFNNLIKRTAGATMFYVTVPVEKKSDV